MSKTKDAPYKLTSEVNKRFFKKEIAPKIEKQTKTVDNPKFVLIGGQPGAGKSRLTAYVKAELKKNTVILDADDFRPMHPHYKDMMKTDPTTVFEAARDDVNAWLEQAGEWARDNKRNVIMDGTLRDKNHTAKLAETYRQAGYKIELNVVATNERNSHTSIFERYEDGIASTGTGRYVEPDFHKSAYEAIPKTVQYLEENKLVDQVKICSRDGEVLYENNLVNGQWEKEPEAAKSLAKERDREPTPEETQWLEKQRANTLNLMEKRKAPAAEKEYVKKQFQEYPIPGREKNQPQHDSEVIRDLYVAQPDRVYSGKIISFQDDSAIQEISPGAAVEHRGIASAMRQDDIGKRFTISYDSQGGVSITQERQLDRSNEIDR